MRILMVGPGRGKPGGILALTEALVPILERQVDLLYFPTVKRLSYKEMGRATIRNIGLALSQYGRFIHTLFRFRPDIVHIHTSQGLGWLKDTFYVLVSKLGGRRIVLHVHAAEYDALYGEQAPILQTYTRRIMNMAHVIIAVSTEWKKALNQIVPDDRIHTFKPCLDVETFRGERPFPPNGTVNALFLGTIGKRKGAFDLLEAMNSALVRQTPLRVWIAGGEENQGDLERARIRLETLRMTDKCELVGTVQGERKTQLLDKADIFVLPSYNEGLPFAVIEAMAAGLPVVATPVGGIPEVVKDGDNGYLIPPGDVDKLAERLARLACDFDLRQNMGKRNRQFAENELDIRPYAKRLVALYNSLAPLKAAIPVTTQIQI